MHLQLGIWKKFIRSLLGVDRCSLSWASGRGLLELYWGWTDAASAGVTPVHYVDIVIIIDSDTGRTVELSLCWTATSTALRLNLIPFWGEDGDAMSTPLSDNNPTLAVSCHTKWSVQTWNDSDWIPEIWSDNYSVRTAFDNLSIDFKVQFMSSSCGRPVADSVCALPFPLDVTFDCGAVPSAH